MSTTAALLQQLRSFGLTQAEIHRRTRIPQPRLSRWERGDVPVGADDALTLAELVRAVEAERAANTAAPTEAPPTTTEPAHG